jgi:hypothetical protein
VGTPLKRVQMLLEPQQHARLAQLARSQGKSVADVTRQAIELGLAQLAEEDLLSRRARALKRADQIAARMHARGGTRREVDVTEGLRRLREERDEHLPHRD